MKRVFELVAHRRHADAQPGAGGGARGQLRRHLPAVGRSVASQPARVGLHARVDLFAGVGLGGCGPHANNETENRTQQVMRNMGAPDKSSTRRP